MATFIEYLQQPWPWYVGGPVIGLFVPALLLLTNRAFGLSSSLRHIVAACIPAAGLAYFQYDWKRSGAWNLFFILGVVMGGAVAGLFLSTGSVELAAGTRADLTALGIRDFSGLMPPEIFSLTGLLSVKGGLLLGLGGFLVGFGARYADGCTSGHGVFGLANFQASSLVAVAGFFIGGLVMTHWILPCILKL